MAGYDDFERLRLRVEIFRILAGQITRFAAMADDGPARRRGRQQTDATFDLPGAYFSSKTLDDACKGIQNEIADTSEARAAIYGSAHVTNQEALRVATAALSVIKEAADMTDIQEEERARKHSHRRQVPPSAGPGSPLSIVCDNEIILTRSIFHRTAKASLADNRTANGAKCVEALFLQNALYVTRLPSIAIVEQTRMEFIDQKILDLLNLPLRFTNFIVQSICSFSTTPPQDPALVTTSASPVMQMINLAMTPKCTKNNKPVRLGFAETPLIPLNSSVDEVASNEDLVMDILSKLPTRLLVRSMCVSKEWNTLIRNPTFQKLRNPNPEPPSGLFMAVSANLYAKCEFVPYDIGNPVKPPLLTPNFDPEANIFFIRNAVNGLFLCTGVSGKDYVCNPTINQFSWLPVRDIDSYLLGMSIAFDPSVSLHYKIAYVYCLKERIFEIRVYSSETRTCKTACIVNLDYNISDIETEFKGGVYWNNVVHWISDNRFMLYFNFDRELVNKISSPSV
ncbi:F-box protein-like protein [Tanacetum coccineum]